jgi:hypothetical protein
MANLPVDLETEDRKNQHRQKAEEKSQDDLASNLKGSFFHDRGQAERLGLFSPL